MCEGRGGLFLAEREVLEDKNIRWTLNKRCNLGIDEQCEAVRLSD